MNHYKFPQNPFGINYISVFAYHIDLTRLSSDNKHIQVIRIQDNGMLMGVFKNNGVDGPYCFDSSHPRVDISAIYQYEEVPISVNKNRSSYKLPDNALGFTWVQIAPYDICFINEKCNKLLMLHFNKDLLSQILISCETIYGLSVDVKEVIQ